MPARTRPPNYPRFIGTGAAVGVLVALVLTVAAPDSDYSGAQILLYSALLLAFLGGLAGGVLAVLFEGRSPRR